MIWAKGLAAAGEAFNEALAEIERQAGEVVGTPIEVGAYKLAIGRQADRLGTLSLRGAEEEEARRIDEAWEIVEQAAYLIVTGKSPSWRMFPR